MTELIPLKKINMIKFSIKIKENANQDTCNVEIIKPKKLEDATQNEKNVTAVVINEIEKSLKNLK